MMTRTEAEELIKFQDSDEKDIEDIEIFSSPNTGF